MRTRENSIRLLPVCTLDAGNTMLNSFTFSGFRRIVFAILMAGSVSISAQDDLIWNSLDPDNTVYLQMRDGTVIIELNPVFAPKTVKQFKKLLEDQFYRGLSFYRVIDGFVAQGGDESDIDGNQTTTLKAEFEIDWPLKPRDKKEAKDWLGMSWTPVQTDDLFAPYTGFIDGFPAARDKSKGGKAWLTHCPGTVAMARNENPDSSGTDFYIVIGQAPRYLDRNLTVVGRVVWGMDVVQRIKRNGVVEMDSIPRPASYTLPRLLRAGAIDLETPGAPLPDIGWSRRAIDDARATFLPEDEEEPLRPIQSGIENFA